MDARKMKRNRSGVMHKMTIRLPEDVYESMRQERDAREITMASYINELLRSDEQMRLRESVLNVKQFVYEIVFTDDEMNAFYDATGMCSGMAGNVQLVGSYISDFIQKWRRGEVFNHVSTVRVTNGDATLSVMLPFLLSHLKKVTGECDGLQKLMQKVYSSPDLLYVYRVMEDDEETGRSKADDGGLVRTMVRIPETQMPDIRKFCSLLHISLTEYFTLLASGTEGTKKLKAKVKMARNVRRIFVADDCTVCIRNFVNEINELMRQVRILDVNAGALMRDMNKKSTLADGKMIVAITRDKEVSLAEYLQSIRTETEAILTSVQAVVDGYLELLDCDPRARERAGLCRIMSQSMYAEGVPGMDDIGGFVNTDPSEEVG